MDNQQCPTRVSPLRWSPWRHDPREPERRRLGFQRSHVTWAPKNGGRAPKMLCQVFHSISNSVHVWGLLLQVLKCSTDEPQATPPGAVPTRTGAEPLGCGGQVPVSGRRPQHSQARAQETPECGPAPPPGAAGLWGPRRWRGRASGVSKRSSRLGRCLLSRGSQQPGPRCARASGDTDTVVGGGGQCRLRAESHLKAQAGPVPQAREERGTRGPRTGREGAPAGRRRLPETVEPAQRGCRSGTRSRTFRLKKRLSSLRALIFMRHGNFDTEKVSVTFSCVRIFYFSRKLQSSNDLINAGRLGRVWQGCQPGRRAVRRWGRAGRRAREGTAPPTPGSRLGRRFPTFVLI